MDTNHMAERRSPLGLRTLGWLAVASMLAMAVIGPGAALVVAGQLSGAVYTSNFDGSIINQNIYEAKADVYLTGGPCQGGSHLPAGDYYLEVLSPNGTLLSTDAIGNRKFTIGANGFIASTAGSHVTHAVNCAPPVTGVTIQFMPYNDTPNPGGEYKFQVGSASSVEACAGFNAQSTSFQICSQADQKSDNFKVRASNPAINIVKLANPTSLPAGGGSVTYTYTVINVGDTALSNVTVVDDKCVPVTFVGGDTNSDVKLDLTETWTYTCTTTITVTTTNIVVASGTSGETTVSDDDTATVTVLPPTPVPPTPTPVPPTVAPTQSLLAATGTPVVTAPPTDAFSDPTRPTNESWRILLIGLAGLLASLLVLTPAPATRRK